MKILSFDQSSNLTGYCLFDGDIIDSGVIDKHKIKDRDIRIAEMSMAIYKKIDEFKPDLVVIENIQKVIAVCKARNKSCGMFMDANSAARWAAEGMNILWITTEMGLLSVGIQDMVNKVRDL